MLVDRVEVGPFLAVDLDIDEELVHPLGDLRIFKALMRHDMTPMTRGIADRQQDRLMSSLGSGDRRLAPWLPVNRVVLVLKEIGARLLAEAVAVHRDSCRLVSGWGRNAADALPSTPRPVRVGILVQETADCVIRSAGPQDPENAN